VSELSSPPPTKPPVLLGCGLFLGSIVVFVVAVVGFVIFLDSGSATGKVTLDRAAAYAEGSVERFADRGFYLVRLRGADIFALVDLDAANRLAQGRRCRVAPIAVADPALPGLLDRYRRSFSPQAAGSNIIFREDCNGALYDVAGMRLDAPGPNLDRFPVEVNEAGFVVVDTARRTCSERDGPDPFAPVACSR
jgi:hypothetical protein